MLNKILRKVIRMFRRRLYENVNNTDFHKHCLLIYITFPFRRNVVFASHQNRWQAKELARIIGEFNYNVDVIDCNDDAINLSKTYDLIIDIYPGLNKSYQDHMSTTCLKVAYMTGANLSFSNKAEVERLEQLYRRKGVRLRQRRYAPPFDKQVFESFDAMFFIGNRHNLKTFAEFDLKKVFFIKNTGYEFLLNQDFQRKSPQNFLYLGSRGQVFRGLDLLLEVFSRNRHLKLYVCGFFKSEKDFCKLYNKELFQSNNIFPVGLIDIRSKKFRQIVSVCSYTILPSCAEGISGGVLTAMSAGLIPIVSRETGLEEGEVHFLPDCSIKSISEAVNYYSKKDMEWIYRESVRVMQTVREQYSNNNFTESIRNAMNGLLTPVREVSK